MEQIKNRISKRFSTAVEPSTKEMASFLDELKSKHGKKGQNDGNFEEIELTG